MARHIDADKLMEAIEKNIEPYKSWDCTKADVVMDTILEQPTADVVEVVRCKDCKHKVDYCGRLMCGRNKYEFAEGVGGLVATLPEHFCSYGERRTT